MTATPLLPRPGHVRMACALLSLFAVGYGDAQDANQDANSADAVARAQAPARPVASKRPEQAKGPQDRPERFAAPNAMPLSPVFAQQPGEGKISGFDFYRDPLNAAKPMQTFDETMAADVKARPGVMQAQQRLLSSRYDLTPRLDPSARMSRGKPLAVGPTARLASGVTWEKLADMTPEAIREKAVFPYPSLPHPKQSTGGQVFPQMQIDQFPRLQRFDVDFDLPEAFLPEFPPAIFLQNRPELGDVSRGEIVTINNFYKLFKDLLTPVQLNGLQVLLTPLPQEEFNPTDDRKSPQPSWEWRASTATSTATPQGSST